mmetsp:Transcript_36473/g.58809  ORF Transcript_36473/g.58809 Transcript_36473/m.58809 type:complete len:238 (-) Transcript_36473:14-727(-)
MVSGIPAMGWLKSRVAVVSEIPFTIAIIGPLGLCTSSSEPTSTPFGSFSSGTVVVCSSSRSPKPASQSSLMSRVSPTTMPFTPLSRPGSTCWPPHTNPRGPLPSDESTSSPVSLRVSLNSTWTIMPSDAGRPPAAVAAARFVAACHGCDSGSLSAVGNLRKASERRASNLRSLPAGSERRATGDPSLGPSLRVREAMAMDEAIATDPGHRAVCARQGARGKASGQLRPQAQHKHPPN